MRRWKRILLSLLIVSITFLYPLLAPTPHRIDEAHADLITAGMTQEQVEAIFGVPEGSYDWAELAIPPAHLVLIEVISRERFAAKLRAASIIGAAGNNPTVLQAISPVHYQTSITWTSRRGAFIVWFDEWERVVSVNASIDVRIVPPWQRWWNQYWKK